MEASSNAAKSSSAPAGAEGLSWGDASDEVSSAPVFSSGVVVESIPCSFSCWFEVPASVSCLAPVVSVHLRDSPLPDAPENPDPWPIRKTEKNLLIIPASY
jgi:hypothetical protein